MPYDAANPEQPVAATPANLEARAIAPGEARINWITGEDGYSDYRPVYSPDGDAVLFERTEIGSGRTTLYIQRLEGGMPEPFLKDPPAGIGAQTRPDWCRATGEVAFCVERGGIWLANGDGTGATPIDGTAGMIYPSWYADGRSLAVMDTRGAPRTVRIDRGGRVLERLTPENLYAGMPSISQQDPVRLAFPGQPAVPPYKQENNHIYIVGTDPTSARELDGKQGRAPWWTPNGELLAFESNRDTGDPYRYAVYLSTPDGSYQVRVTDVRFNAQHPKFSPDARRIVLAAQPAGGSKENSWAIGWLQFTT
ncbi:MAG: TolB family protein [Longimicrobiaceae bacterium]